MRDFLSQGTFLGNVQSICPWDTLRLNERQGLV